MPNLKHSKMALWLLTLLGWFVVCPFTNLAQVPDEASPQPSASPSSDADSTPPAATPADSPPPLIGEQKSVAERFSRLEMLLLRSADLEAGENPTRAALLQQAVQLSKQAELTELLADAASNLERGQYSEAIEKQKLSRESLKRLLELLQSENREQRIREQRDEVRRWIEETDRLLRLQSSLRGRTEGGQDVQQAAQDQQKLSRKATEIADELKSDQTTPLNDPAQSPADDPTSDEPESDEPKSDEPKSDEPKSGEPKSGEPEVWRTQIWRTRSLANSKSGEPKSDEPKSGEPKSGEPQVWRTQIWRTQVWRTQIWRTQIWRTRSLANRQVWRTGVWRSERG